MDPGDIQKLFDADVIGHDTSRVGTVEQIFADDVTGQATFVTVKDDAGTEHFIPVRGASFEDGTLSVPYDADAIKAAPVAKGNADLSHEQELAVFEHYGAGSARPSEDPATEDVVDADVVPGHDAYRPSAESAEGEVPESEAQSGPVEGQDVAEPTPEPAEATQPWQVAGGADVPTEDSLARDAAEEAPSAATEGKEADPASVEAREDQPATEEGPDGAALGLLAGGAVAGGAVVAAAEHHEPATDEPTPAQGVDTVEPADDEQPEAPAEPTTSESAASPTLGLPAGAKLRKYVVTELMTVQIPVRREIVCWEDADGALHELDVVEAPVPDESTPEGRARTDVNRDPHDPANWWFADANEGVDPVG